MQEKLPDACVFYFYMRLPAAGGYNSQNKLNGHSLEQVCSLCFIVGSFDINAMTPGLLRAIRKVYTLQGSVAGGTKPLFIVDYFLYFFRGFLLW